VYEILVREDLAPVTKLFEVRAPAVARKARAGQFVIVRSLTRRADPADHCRLRSRAGNHHARCARGGKTTMQMGTSRPGITYQRPAPSVCPATSKRTARCCAWAVGGYRPIFPIARAT
jgi:ferredoxin--NADP+ reductase